MIEMGLNMRHILENETLRIEIESHGAELKSVRNKKEDREYMWWGDAKYWGRTSPVLFPFVGAPKNRQYRYNGKIYTMGQHGFARDMEFELEESKKTEIWFVLESTRETYENYPFHFRLHIGYELRENEVNVQWKVENTDTKEIYFSIGAHPAFLCPIHGEQNKIGYGLKFDGLTTELCHYGNTADGMAVTDEKILPLQSGCVKFAPGFFDDCTYMAGDKQTTEISLFDTAGEIYVTVAFDAPLFAIWSPEGKDAPFVCIEPWYGRCDAVDFSGSLQERAYENELKIGGEFCASYQMKFF